ncbi:MAG: ABC transporter substrate-binding protein, partial [Alphaproteobacteria bacterium]|nr:ABC transporter substrate-binding protein [Alphaproteobacteria bacterium]
HALKRGIDFAIKDINDNPENKFVYRVIVEDNQMQPRLTVPIANKMISRESVAAITTAFSASARATKPLLVQNKVIGLHGTPVLDVLDGVYNFNLYQETRDVVRDIAEFVNARKPARVALVLQHAGTATELFDGLKGALHGEIRIFENQAGDRDFGMQVRKIKEWNPDFMILAILPPEMNIFVKELHSQQVGGTKMWYGLSNSTDDFSLFDGFYTYEYSQGNKEFTERFGSALTFFAAYYYDGLRVFAKATEMAAGEDGAIPSAEKISAAIKKIRNHQGVVGHIDILDTGVFRSAGVVYKIENGQIVAVK